MQVPIKTPGLLRVASYNIRKCIGLDRRRRPDRVLAALGEVNADIVVLQEVDRRLGARRATLAPAEIAAATGLVPLAIAQNGISLGWHGNAVLARPELAVADVTCLTLPGLEPRGAVIATLETEFGRMRLVALHLGLARRHRRQQLRRITAQLMSDDGVPTLIAGDFNEWSPSIGLEALHDYAVHIPGKSYHSARPVAALDRIAVSEGIDVAGAGVHRTGAARHASDHLPVWADIRLAGACNIARSGVDAAVSVGV